jgi:hypothetical protein
MTLRGRPNALLSGISSPPALGHLALSMPRRSGSAWTGTPSARNAASQIVGASSSKPCHDGFTRSSYALYGRSSMSTPPGTYVRAISVICVPRSIHACISSSASSSGAVGSCAIHHRRLWHWRPAMTRDFERAVISPARRVAPSLTTPSAPSTMWPTTTSRLISAFEPSYECVNNVSIMRATTPLTLLDQRSKSPPEFEAPSYRSRRSDRR